MHSLPLKREDMYPMLMTVLLLYGTDAELLIYVSSQLLFLRAEHLDVGFMLSGFRRRQKVSQRPVFVLGRLPRRERRVSKVATRA